MELLTGAYRAALPDGSGAEWPPHPERLFSALVQAWGDGGRVPAERAALEWLERLDPPGIEASALVSHRDAPTVFVPPNDPRGGDETVLPHRRKRQARTFEAAIPEGRLVRFRWNGDAPPETAAALHDLAARIASVGHSSSLVRCAFVQPREMEPSSQLWLPSERGKFSLRASYEGRLEDLERWFGAGEGKRTERPRTRRVVRYEIMRQGEPSPVARSVFGSADDWFVFEDVGGFRPDLLAFAHVARRVRDALMSLGPQPPPEALSGHEAGGGPTSRPHVAIVPLANIGSKYGTGDLLGFAVVVPRELTQAERERVLMAIARFAALDDEGEAVARVRLTAEHEWLTVRSANPSRASLQPARWCASARSWATVTPMLLDRFPDADDPAEAAAIVAAACVNIGLPEPEEIELHKHSVWPAAPSAHLRGAGRHADWSFPAEARFRNRPRRHVVVRFSKPVEGPLLLGAGRFFGFGLCLPLESGGRP